MKTLKSDIFYAMNEINDKYILEAAQCLEQKKKSDISSQKKIKLFNESNAHSRKRLARVATVMVVSIILFTTGGIANAATGGKLVQWINGLFGAELVTDENEGLIGKEVIDNSKSEITHGGRPLQRGDIDHLRVDVGPAQLAQALRRERDVALALIALLGIVFGQAVTQHIAQITHCSILF